MNLEKLEIDLDDGVSLPISVTQSNEKRLY